MRPKSADVDQEKKKIQYLSLWVSLPFFKAHLSRKYNGRTRGNNSCLIDPPTLRKTFRLPSASLISRKQTDYGPNEYENLF